MAVVVADVVNEDDADDDALVVSVDAAEEEMDEDAVVVTVVRSHVRPDPSNKLLMAKFRAEASSLHADLREGPSTTATVEHVKPPTCLFTNLSSSNSLITLFNVSTALLHAVLSFETAARIEPCELSMQAKED